MTMCMKCACDLLPYDVPPFLQAQIDRFPVFSVRAGASELHTVSSLLGGIVSQEAIKVLTRQYVPMENTVIINTIKSTSSVYSL